MKISNYNIDLEKIAKQINEKKFKKILLQLPEGLKQHMDVFVDFFEKNACVDVVVSCDPCFGACDIPYICFKKLGFDCVVQIGHLPIENDYDFDVPVFFVNAYADIDLLKTVGKTLDSLKGKRIGLVSTAQHVHKLDDVKKFLLENGFEPVVGKGDSRIHVKGQVLGCNFSSAKSISGKVDYFLFIGSGSFHPLGLILSTKKPVIAVDPYTGEVKNKELEETKDLVLRQRYGAIARSKDAKVFGIIVGLKSGQQRFDLVDDIKEKIHSRGKKSYVISADFVNPMMLEGFKNIDCFVSTVCPRIAIDDYMQYKNPILTPVELDVLIGFKKWDEYSFDEISQI